MAGENRIRTAEKSLKKHVGLYLYAFYYMRNEGFVNDIARLP